MTISKEL